MRTYSISIARQLIESRGGRVRMTGGGLVDDPSPQLEASKGKGQWSYVAQIAEGEVSADHVDFWIDQHLDHDASEHDTDTPGWERPL